MDLRFRLTNDTFADESNDDDGTPDYRKSSFQSEEIYAMWKAKQLEAVERLITIWCPLRYNLKSVCTKSSKYNVFKEYRMLLEALFRYYSIPHDNNNKSETDLHSWLKYGPIFYVRL